MKRLAGLLLVVLALGGIVVAQNALLINGAGLPSPIQFIQNGSMNFTRPTAISRLTISPLVLERESSRQRMATVDFGASDGPMTEEQLKAYSDKHGSAILHFPTVLAPSFRRTTSLG